jgi:hypothetical protein
MTKLMSQREMALFRVAMNYCHAYHECNPNVGWGYTIEGVAEEVAKKTGFEWDEDDIAECCEGITGS